MKATIIEKKVPSESYVVGELVKCSTKDNDTVIGIVVSSNIEEEKYKIIILKSDISSPIFRASCACYTSSFEHIEKFKDILQLEN